MWGMISAIVLLFVVFQAGLVQSARKPKCDHTTEVCDCTAEPDDGTPCEFTMEIEHLQTFTKYEVNTKSMPNKRGPGGRVWYIDSTGDLMAHPDGSVCPQDESSSCTDPITVDGFTFRSVIAINGRFPGPTLIVNKDDYVVVTVTNKLASESISVHWHGMHQRDSYWMDGVEHVTQCGIPPGATFKYIFHANISGTHWYHSHSGAQRTEGLFGTLIVNETTSTIDEVKKVLESNFMDLPAHSLTFLDWQKENSIDLFTQIHSGIRFYDVTEPPDQNTQAPPRTYSTDDAEVGPVSYWSGLINGRGRHKDRSFVQTRLSIFTVEPNQEYRFRLIGAQSLFAYRVSIDGHKMKVIATDGAFVMPVVVDFIIIHSGERYDFILETKSPEDVTSTNNFAIRAETLERFAGDNREDVNNRGMAEAILHYEMTNSVRPSSSEYEAIFASTVNQINCAANPPCVALNCPFKAYPEADGIDCIHIHQLETMFPLSADELPNASPNSATKMFFNFGFEGVSSTSSINGRNLRLPSTPLLFSDEMTNRNGICQDLTIKARCDSSSSISEDCICTHVHEISSSVESVQLVISAVAPKPNTDGLGIASFAHPVHLHGHYFHVVDIQFGEYDSKGKLESLNTDIDCQGTNLCTVPRWVNDDDKNDYSTEIVNATRKDTILIPYGGYAVVYFKPDNPGYWFLHCHIEVHQLEGMGVIISEKIDQATSPPDGFPRCGDFDSFNVNDFISARRSNSYSRGDSIPSNSPPASDPDKPGRSISATEIWALSSTIIAIAAIVVAVILGAICIKLCIQRRKSY